MCGRLNVTADPLTQLLMEAFGIDVQVKDNHNLAPTESLLVIRNAVSIGSGKSAESDPATAQASPSSGELQADELRWWLTPSWSSGPSTKYAMFNARSESLLNKPAFARLYKSQRCVVPVSGYYEWQKGERGKLPCYVHGYESTGLLLAGLWDRWRDDATGEELHSCTIVTAAADDAIGFLHHRQPVFLSVDEAQAWLDVRSDVAELGVLLEPHLAGTLQIDAVSTYVNNARNKGARCIQAIAEPVIVSAGAEPPYAATNIHPLDSSPEQDLFDS